MNKNALEWTVFGVSLAVIAAVVGVLLHEYLTNDRTPATIVVTAGRAVEAGGGYTVPVEVRNDGNRTAEDVRIEATLQWTGGRETGEAVLPYVPYRSQRRAWIAFSRDPRAGTLEVRVRGYREP